LTYICMLSFMSHSIKLLFFVIFPTVIWGQIFQQDYSSSTTVSSYVNLSSPTISQFNAIGTSGAGVVTSINSGKLRIARSGSNAGSFSRTTDFSPTPSTMMYTFDLTISGNSVAQTTAAVFQVGSAYGTANNPESNANTHSRIGLNLSSTTGQFTLRDIGAGTNSTAYSGTQSITWVINNSGSSLTYTAPNGTSESIADDKADVWIGNTREFNDISATTTSQLLTDLKFVFNAGTATVDIDNIVINKLCVNPITLHASTATGNTEQCYDDGWHYYGTTSANYFGLKKNGNIITNTIDLTLGSTISKTSSNGSNQEHGMFLMGRYWNGTLNSGSISTPIDIRFFYDPTELAAAKTDRDNSFTSLSGSTLAVTSGNTAEWFKNTNGVPFDASYIASTVGNKFPSTYIKFSSPTISTLNSLTYVELTGITSFSGGTGGYSYGPTNTSGGNALPVAWGDMYVQSVENGYEIKWTTLSEKNSKHFDLEYSYDGVIFLPISTKLKAAGFSQELKNYSYFHNDNSKRIYYKIKQVDKEDNYELSKILSGSKSTSTIGDIMIIPYLTDGKHLVVYSTSKLTTPLHIEIYDMYGRLIFTASEQIDNLVFDKEYDISNIANGRYIVKLNYLGKATSTKLEKL
jgi:hypothetical protein